jgi:hypothetical protein
MQEDAFSALAAIIFPDDSIAGKFRVPDLLRPYSCSTWWHSPWWLDQWNICGFLYDLYVRFLAIGRTAAGAMEPVNNGDYR